MWVIFAICNMGPTGRPFDFFLLGRLRVISEKKNILQTDFEGKQSCKEISGGKFCCTEKNLWWCIMLEKKFYTTICRGKNSISRGLRKEFFPKPNHPCPPQKSHDFPLKWVQVLAVPFIFGIARKTGLFCSANDDTIFGTNALPPS